MTISLVSLENYSEKSLFQYSSEDNGNYFSTTNSLELPVTTLSPTRNKHNKKARKLFDELRYMSGTVDLQSHEQKKVSLLTTPLFQTSNSHPHLFNPINEMFFHNEIDQDAHQSIQTECHDESLLSHWCFKSLLMFQERVKKIDGIAYGLIKGDEQNKLYLIRAEPFSYQDDQEFDISVPDFISLDTQEITENNRHESEGIDSLDQLFGQLQLQQDKEVEAPLIHTFEYMPIVTTRLEDTRVVFKYHSPFRKGDVESSYTFSIFKKRIEQAFSMQLLKYSLR